MRSGHLNGAAIDVFNDEPYSGNFTKLENCILTAHMGSCPLIVELVWK